MNGLKHPLVYLVEAKIKIEFNRIIAQFSPLVVKFADAVDNGTGA